MTLGLGMQHRGHGPNKVYSNDDLVLNLTFLWHGQICFLVLLYGKIYIPSEKKKLESHLIEKTYKKWPEWQKVFVYVDIKILTPRVVCPCPRAIYMYKTWTNMYKIRLQRDCFETCKWESDKAFLLTSKLCPQRVVCPCPAAIYMYKNMKKYV